MYQHIRKNIFCCNKGYLVTWKLIENTEYAVSINVLGRVKRSRNRVHGSINIKRYICNKIRVSALALFTTYCIDLYYRYKFTIVKTRLLQNQNIIPP